MALAFSGGLDSTIIACLARDLTQLRAYTVGFPLSKDMENAREAAEMLGLRWRGLLLDDSILLKEAAEFLWFFPGTDPVSLSFELPLWALMRRCREVSVLAGQGADELFGGYARYEGLHGRALSDALDRDFVTLMERTLPREAEMARLNGKRLRLPYCDLGFLSVALAIPPEERIGPRRKELLRRVAESLSLPKVLVDRPKKAAQYGSGVMPRLKEIARGRGMRVEQLLLNFAPKAGT